MEFETKKEGDILLVKPLINSITASSSSNFREKMVSLIHQGNKKFLLNLSQVEFIDSSGLGAIISILKILTVDAGKIAICKARNPVSNLFKMTRLNNVLNLFEEEKEALNSLSDS